MLHCRPPSLSAVVSSTRVAPKAGARPNSTPVRSEIAAVNPRTRVSGERSSAGPALWATSLAKPSVPQNARSRPAAPPNTASSRLSVSSCRMSLQRPAPMESLSAISFCRAAPGASSRLAMLAQAISSTSPTRPINILPNFQASGLLRGEDPQAPGSSSILRPQVRRLRPSAEFPIGYLRGFIRNAAPAQARR